MDVTYLTFLWRRLIPCHWWCWWCWWRWWCDQCNIWLLWIERKDNVIELVLVIGPNSSALLVSHFSLVATLATIIFFTRPLASAGWFYVVRSENSSYVQYWEPAWVVMYITKSLCHVLWCLKSQIIDNKCMFILTIIAAVLLDTLSLLPAACLNKTDFSNRHLKDFRVSLSWTKFPRKSLSTLHYWTGIQFSFTALTAISQSTSNLST